MADLWTIPATAPYLWATNPGTRTTPTTGRKATGWTPGEPGSALQVNDLWGMSLDWISVLAEILPADGTVAAQVVQVYDTAATPNLGGTLTAPAANQVDLTTGAGVVSFTATGIPYVRATAGTYGIRYGYDTADQLVLEHHFSPLTGGFTLLSSSFPAAVSVLELGGNTARIGNTALVPQAIQFRRPLVIPYDPASTGPAYFAKFITLSAVFTGAASDIQVRMTKVLRSSGAETVLATLDQATTSYTFPGSGTQADPEFWDYFIEIYGPAVGAGALTTDGVRSITLEAEHGRLNPVL